MNEEIKYGVGQGDYIFFEKYDTLEEATSFAHEMKNKFKDTEYKIVKLSWTEIPS